MADSAKCQQYIIGLVPSGLIGHDLLNSFATSSFVCKYILNLVMSHVMDSRSAAVQMSAALADSIFIDERNGQRTKMF